MLNPPPEKLAAISGIWSVAPTVVTLCMIQNIHYERRRNKNDAGLLRATRREGGLKFGLIRAVVCEADLCRVGVGTPNARIA